MREKIKIAVIGAASPQWGYTIVRDLFVRLSKDDIIERYEPIVVLQDIDAARLNDFVKLCSIIAEKTFDKVKYEVTTNQKKALDQARFVVVTIAVGSLEAMQHDIEIPPEYGIFMPVGDSISVGGAIRAARNIPALLSIARDLQQHGHPQAMIINLSNPMSMLCRAVTKYTKIRTVGCCHELYNGINFLSRIFPFNSQQWKQRIELELFGINHCGWIVKAAIDGRDMLQEFRDYLDKHSIDVNSKRLYNTTNTHLTRHNVKINLFLKYGALPFSGDRHTAEFFTDFANKNTNKGADYGVLLTSIQERLLNYRNDGRTKIADIINRKTEPVLDMSKEIFSEIIASTLIGESFTDVGNTPYTGNQFPGIPQGTVLERMVKYKPNEIEPLPISANIPEFVLNHVSLHAGIIEDIVQACVEGDKNLFTRTLFNDPMLKNMDTDKINGMLRRLFHLNKKYIHQGLL